MNYASIDCGTNTIILLIGNEKSEVLYEKFSSPRIGKNLVKGICFPKENIDRLVSVLTDYKNIASRFGCYDIIIGGTAPFRNALDSKEVQEMLKTRLNLVLNILSEDEEAEIAFLGTLNASNPKKNYTVIDIGGSSTEFSYGSVNGLKQSISFPIGAVNLTERFAHLTPQERIKATEEAALNMFNGSNFSPEKDFEIVGISGTPVTISSIVQELKEYDAKKLEKSEITISDIDHQIALHSNMTIDEIKTAYGSIVEGREDILLTGEVILLTALNYLGKECLTVSTKGLRHGLLYKKIAALN